MSIISWTSPEPSEAIFPTSIDTSRPSAGLLVRNSSPNSRTSSPRFGAGTARHCRKAAWASSIARLTPFVSVSRTRAMISPVIGERAASVPPAWLARSTPSSPRSRATSSPSFEWSTVPIVPASDMIILSSTPCRRDRWRPKVDEQEPHNRIFIASSPHRRSRQSDGPGASIRAGAGSLSLRLARGLAHGAVAPVGGRAAGGPAAAKRNEQRRGVGQPVGVGLHASHHGGHVGRLRIEQRELIDLALIELLADDVETGLCGLFRMYGRFHRARIRLQGAQRVGDVLECRNDGRAILRVGL